MHVFIAVSKGEAKKKRKGEGSVPLIGLGV
jgi:hypothetical protein